MTPEDEAAYRERLPRWLEQGDHVIPEILEEFIEALDAAREDRDGALLSVKTLSEMNDEEHALNVGMRQQLLTTVESFDNAKQAYGQAKTERDEALADLREEGRAAAELLAYAERLRAALAKVEWIEPDETIAVNCPACFAGQGEGHDCDCTTAQALALSPPAALAAQQARLTALERVAKAASQVDRFYEHPLLRRALLRLDALGEGGGDAN